MTDLLELIEELRVFAIVRAGGAGEAAAAARACLRGGIRLLEIAMTVPGALEVVAGLGPEPGAVPGVGSVLEPSQVADAARAGARFVVSPHLDPEVVAEARRRGMLAVAGGVTPTEVLGAHRAGADIVKVFPASSFGGPAHLRALREPLPFVRLMPTGGVEESNVAAYLDAGACAVGVGGSLLGTAGGWGAVEERARRLQERVAAWRSGRRP